MVRVRVNEYREVSMVRVRVNEYRQVSRVRSIGSCQWLGV